MGFSFVLTFISLDKWSLTPALFIAADRNLYSVSGIKLLISVYIEGSIKSFVFRLKIISFGFDQFEFVSIHCIWYPSTSDSSGWVKFWLISTIKLSELIIFSFIDGVKLGLVKYFKLF